MQNWDDLAFEPGNGESYNENTAIKDGPVVTECSCECKTVGGIPGQSNHLEDTFLHFLFRPNQPVYFPGVPLHYLCHMTLDSLRRQKKLLLQFQPFICNS